MRLQTWRQCERLVLKEGSDDLLVLWLSASCFSSRRQLPVLALSQFDSHLQFPGPVSQQLDDATHSAWPVGRSLDLIKGGSGFILHAVRGAERKDSSCSEQIGWDGCIVETAFRLRIS
jgi:hypothetical protein